MAVGTTGLLFVLVDGFGGGEMSEHKMLKTLLFLNEKGWFSSVRAFNKETLDACAFMREALAQQPADVVELTDAHPMQPVVMVGDVARFKANPIVEHLLDNGGIDMNALARMDFSREDREQFAQLIGYSVSGFGSLSYASDEVCDKAIEAADTLIAAHIAKQGGA